MQEFPDSFWIGYTRSFGIKPVAKRKPAPGLYRFDYAGYDPKRTNGDKAIYFINRFQEYDLSKPLAPGKYLDAVVDNNPNPKLIAYVSPDGVTPADIKAELLAGLENDTKPQLQKIADGMMARHPQLRVSFTPSNAQSDFRVYAPRKVKMQFKVRKVADGSYLASAFSSRNNDSWNYDDGGTYNPRDFATIPEEAKTVLTPDGEFVGGNLTDILAGILIPEVGANAAMMAESLVDRLLSV
jgi:hypothetical protein